MPDGSGGQSLPRRCSFIGKEKIPSAVSLALHISHSECSNVLLLLFSAWRGMSRSEYQSVGNVSEPRRPGGQEQSAG